MRFQDYFVPNSHPIISFEVFPPKTDAGMRQLIRVLPRLIELEPSYMTVTYGAGGSTRARTLDIASRIKNEYGVETACHLTCVGSSRSDIDRILYDIVQVNIENIVALRGDPPRGQANFTLAKNGYEHANELVVHIRRFQAEHELADFGVAVAGYPEKHIEAPDMVTDLVNLKRKVDSGADIIITQLFYDVVDFIRFRESVRSVGIDKPIIPGLLPVLSAKQIRRITSLCGVKIPAELQAELDAAGDDDVEAERIGVCHCVAQATELLRQGVPGIHFYVLNKSSHMIQIMEQLRPVIQQMK